MLTRGLGAKPNNKTQRDLRPNLEPPAKLKVSFPEGALQGALSTYSKLQCMFKGALQGAKEN